MVAVCTGPDFREKKKEIEKDKRPTDFSAFLSVFHSLDCLDARASAALTALSR
jgi:hypothetical protein